MIYAGIDEAGYGPTLGPFTVGISGFRVRADLGEETVDLYRELQAAVARRPTAGRIAIADSKELYSPTAGLKHLEEALFSFLAAGGAGYPAGLLALLERLCACEVSELATYPWYREASLAAPLPRAADAAQLGELAPKLAAAFAGRHIEPVCLQARAVFEGEFNASLARTQNKSVTTFRIVQQLLLMLWEEYGAEGVRVQVDKQGGRNFYEPLLQEIFPVFSIEAGAEGAASSFYSVRHGGRAMDLEFAPRSEARHLPVALASIVAKYVRELLMERLNDWFAAQQPGLRPTAGYPEDARRWLADMARLRERLGIADSRLIRAR